MDKCHREREEKTIKSDACPSLVSYREVGIECQEVPGHSKGVGYRQGQSLREVKSDHLWNVVLLGGQWFLLDACWGAGRVDMEHESFVKRFEEREYKERPSRHSSINQEKTIKRASETLSNSFFLC